MNLPGDMRILPSEAWSCVWPDHPGYYWVAIGLNEPEIVRIRRQKNGKLIVVDTRLTVEEWVEMWGELEVLWRGPLTPPSIDRGPLVPR